jgi:DNA-directed RNA polymerase subunit RPC12/RpoP
MTYHKTCMTCGKEYEAKNSAARYCPPCRIKARKEQMRKHNEERKALTARVNAIAGRVEYNSRTPKPCRCKMPSALVVGYGFPADGSRTRHVICMQCGRRGPDAKTPSEAIKAWNKEN